MEPQSPVVLLVDDEPGMRELLRMYCETAGLQTVEAGDAAAALSLSRRHTVSMVILDWMLPDLSGVELCRILRRSTDVPILMLTARGDVEDRVEGLHAGADDYLSKPFDYRELLARLEALLRRTDAKRSQLTRCGEATLDEAARAFMVRGAPLALTRREFDLLHFLMRHPKRVFNREQLLDLVWGIDYLGDERTVDTHVKSLREKLREAGASQVHIETMRGVGYLYRCEPAQGPAGGE